MKPIRSVLKTRACGFLIAVTLGVCLTAWAQTNPLPSVSVVATDPIASWSGDSGSIVFLRSGDASQDLNVYCRILGTATNGVDYQTLSNFVKIPAGAYSNAVAINPINHGQTVIKTVTLALAASPLLIPVNYTIGSPSNATVFIEPGLLTNFPPIVKVATPPGGAVFYTPTNIPICAYAYDLDGYVATVEFFAGTTSLGVRTNNPMSASPVNPFCLVWSNPPAGTFALTALATDNGGATAVSEAVNITVQTGPPPPKTNLPPVVRITSPPNGAVFGAPVDIPLYAYAADFDGSVATVEFFAGTNSLGLGHGISAVWPSITNYWPGFHYPTNLFVLVWSNAPLGSFALTAVATDNGGAATTSPVVNISVLASPPPPTNRPAVVSIVASDPIAIEGTNCWPWLGLTNPVPTWSNWSGGASFCRFFTNCGPKDATFTVRRYGDTNGDLIIQYAVGGTATNGVDYVPLSGTVTIPAGERRASVNLVPLEDGAPDITSTVVLKLLPGTNYLVGFPARAAAVILDSQFPHPITGLLPDDSFQLSASGPDGAWFHVEYSNDMVNWNSICTNQVVNGQINFIDPDAASHPSRFYRAVPEAVPPF